MATNLSLATSSIIDSNHVSESSFCRQMRAKGRIRAGKIIWCMSLTRENRERGEHHLSRHEIKRNQQHAIGYLIKYAAQTYLFVDKRASRDLTYYTIDILNTPKETREKCMKIIRIILPSFYLKKKILCHLLHYYWVPLKWLLHKWELNLPITSGKQCIIFKYCDYYQIILEISLKNLQMYNCTTQLNRIYFEFEKKI